MRTLVIADTWQWTPFVFLIVYARLQGLPQHVLEAAQVDGAGRWATFRHITLPLLAPAIAFAAIFRAIDAFRSFDLVFGLTYGGPARSTTTLSFLTYQSGFQFQQYGYSAAIAYVMVVDPHRAVHQSPCGSCALRGIGGRMRHIAGPRRWPMSRCS